MFNLKHSDWLFKNFQPTRVLKTSLAKLSTGNLFIRSGPGFCLPLGASTAKLFAEYY